jgi:hypothetical protein
MKSQSEEYYTKNTNCIDIDRLVSITNMLVDIGGLIEAREYFCTLHAHKLASELAAAAKQQHGPATQAT